MRSVIGITTKRTIQKHRRPTSWTLNTALWDHSDQVTQQRQEHLTLYLEQPGLTSKNRALCLYRLQSSVVLSKFSSRHSSCVLQADAQCNFDLFFTTV